MGIIIDSIVMHQKFLNIYNQDFQCKTLNGSIEIKKLFVDKSGIITCFNKLINKDNAKNVCITKPRRFGKTSIGAMLVSYYSKGIDSKEIFDKLKVSKGISSKENINKLEREQYAEFQNKYHTLYFDFSYGVNDFNTLDDYLSSINQDLKRDIKKLYPDSDILEYYNDRIYKNLQNLYNEREEKFILIIDEWDHIISSKKFTYKDRNRYISFLQYLIKDRPYIAFTYMTGILPIAKQLSQSTLNCFNEYFIIKDKEYYKYFGFTSKEVRSLCENNKVITYKKLKNWYNGYKGPKGKKIFNTWSVCQALQKNTICNYWTNVGRFDELIKIINFNINGVKDDILELIRGKKLLINIRKYGAEDKQKELEKKNEEKSEDTKKKELYSEMVTYGFLTYYRGKISIPNKELLEKFKELLREQKDNMKYYYDMIENSDKMIKATLNKDTNKMCEILENSHMEKIVPTDKMDHGNLKRIIDFVYFNIRMKYEHREEINVGKGTADFIFKPKKKNETVIIIELKVDDSANAAIKQIHDKKYYHNLKKKGYTGNVLLIGLSYRNNSKTYRCKVEEYDCDLNQLSSSESSSESLNKRKNMLDHGISKKLKKE